MASSGYNPPLLEPKEEPLDDFLLTADENEAYAQSAAIMKKEVKEEPIDLVDSFPVENEISNLVPVSSSPVKNEPDEYIQDLVGLGLIPAWDAALDQSARYGMPPVVEEEPKKEIKEEVDSVVTQRLELADDLEPAIKKSRLNSKTANEMMQSLDKSAGNNTLPKLSVESESNEADRDEVNRESGERKVQSKSVMKKLIGMKNDIELKCPEPRCLFRSKFVRVWIRHLKKKHSKTLRQAGLMLRCKCGNKSRTGAHILECNATNNCVVRVDQKISGEIKCPECQFRTKSPRFWIDHLKSEHSTTPQLAGLALLCECGHETLSYNHRNKCPIAIFSIIRKRDGPIRRLDDDVNENQSPILHKPMEVPLDSIPIWSEPLFVEEEDIKKEELLEDEEISNRYAMDENDVKKEEIIDNAEFVGVLDQTGDENMSHLSPVEPKTEVMEDRVVISVENVDSQVKCILCDVHSKTPGSYAHHLRICHKSTLIASGIYLRGYCGFEFRDPAVFAIHNKNCECRKFTVHNIEKKTPKCVLSYCKAYPATASAYITHLHEKHRTTLSEKGIYLRCGCGVEVHNRDDSRKNKHCCDGRVYSLHNIITRDEEILNLPLPSPNTDEPVTDTQDLLILGQTPIHYSSDNSTKEVQGTVKCVLCESNPSTIHRYANHLMDMHKSTLTENGIFLRCWCGIEVRSCSSDLNHSMQCEGRQFALHKITEE